MKVRIARATEGPNPLYSAADHHVAQEKGEVYDVPPYVTLLPGTEIEHPRAHLLCVVQPGAQPPKAVPIDAAAKKKVEESNQRFKARLQAMANTLSGLKQRLKTDKDGNLVPTNKAEDHFLEMCEAYGLYSLNKAKPRSD